MEKGGWRDRNNSRRVHPIHCWMEKWIHLHSCRHHTLTNLYSRRSCHSRLRLYRIYCSVSNNHHHQRIEHLRKKLHNEEMRFEIVRFTFVDFTQFAICWNYLQVPRSTGIQFSGEVGIPLESMMKKIKSTETRHNFIFGVDRFCLDG